MKDGLNRFRKVCPRHLECLPNEPCPLALEQINAIKAEGTDKRKRDADPLPGCPWYIASAEHNNCFWSLSRCLEGDTVPDREICDMLLINKYSLERTTDSLIEKLKALKDTEMMQDFKDSVLDMIDSQSVDYTNYMPNEFRDSIAKAAEPESDDKPKVKLRKHPTGLPLHRDGTKVDLYGLTSRRKMKQRQDEPKPEVKKQKNPKGKQGKKNAPKDDSQ